MSHQDLYSALQQSGAPFVDRAGIMTEQARRMWLSIPTLHFDTYTPTLTAVANVTALTAYACQYAQLGRFGFVSGQLGVDPTAGSTLTRVGLSLPVGSSLTAAGEVGGTAAQAELSLAAAIRADATNDRAELAYTTTADVADRVWSFWFGYQILG